MQLRRQILRVTILAWLVAHFDHAVTRSGVIPLVFFGYLLHATAPCVVELAGVGVDDVIVITSSTPTPASSTAPCVVELAGVGVDDVITISLQCSAICRLLC